MFFVKLKTLVLLAKTYGLFYSFRFVFGKVFNSNQSITSQTNVKSSASSFLREISNSNLEKFLADELYLSDATIKEALSICDKVSREILEHKREKVYFTNSYDLGRNTNLLMTSVMLHSKSNVVIETGVAAGNSSFHILEVLDYLENDGKLISFDITKKCGQLIPMRLKDKWSLIVLRGDKKKSFRSHLMSIENCDLFLHDSNHDSKWQEFEVTTVIELFPNIRTLIVDDITQELLELNINNFKKYLIREPTKTAAIFIRQ